ncbi:kinase-like domain-containing protein [Hypoxylon sp. NC1633]|nr:kinase-like domain-containing protein [Hypoxylon sp. NC1633]
MSQNSQNSQRSRRRVDAAIWRRMRRFDKYLHYRLGLDWDDAERKLEFYGMPELPLPGTADIFNAQSLILPEQRRQLDVNRIPYRRSRRTRDRANIDNMSKPKPGLEAAWEATQRLKTGFTEESHIKYQKCLGWGGQGLAASLIEYNDKDEEVRHLVVKTGLGAWDGVPMLQREKQFLRAFLKAEHIVQLVDVGANLLEPQANPDAMLVMEMVPNGDLRDLFVKVRDHKETIPQKILWSFFLCLVRACTAMAHPPSQEPGYDNNPGPITERVPRGKDNDASRLVHFDIDPCNLFVGEVPDAVGTGEHAFAPVLKLGDFGVAAEIDSTQQDEYFENLRGNGKRGFWAPEQFTVEWEHIPLGSGAVNREGVPGNFGAHTNIWAVGLTMETMITLCTPAIPPIPSYATVRCPPGKSVYVTYAGHLFGPQYSRIDIDLRSLIARCQAHDPRERPTLRELETTINNALAQKVYPGETPQALLDWMRRVMFEPSPHGQEPDPTDDEPGAGPAMNPNAPAFQPYGYAPGVGHPAPPQPQWVYQPNIAQGVLPHPPAAMAPNGYYIPPPAGGPGYPVYTPHIANVPTAQPWMNPQGYWGPPPVNPMPADPSLARGVLYDPRADRGRGGRGYNYGPAPGPGGPAAPPGGRGYGRGLQGGRRAWGFTPARGDDRGGFHRGRGGGGGRRGGGGHRGRANPLGNLPGDLRAGLPDVPPANPPPGGGDAPANP